MERLLFIILIAATGYLILPLAGAFRVRRRWRNFRNAIYASMTLPVITYADLRQGSRGRYRFFGRIEASQGEDHLWLSDGRLSLQIDLNGVEVYTLPAVGSPAEEGRIEENELTIAEGSPAALPSRRLAALPVGTQMMVAGDLSLYQGRAVLGSSAKEELLCLIYDGEAESILRRAIWSGRQRNEYWNQLTPLSLTLASFTLFILAYIFLRTPRLLPFAHIALTLSLVPPAPLLPPGILFFSLYRRIWRSGRYLRAERDLIALPTRRFAEDADLSDGSRTELPDGSLYRVEVFPSCERALEACKSSKIRTSLSLIGREFGNLRCFAFGCSPVRPGRSDPFAESLLIPGDPRELSRRCGVVAKQREIIAALFFLLAMIVNVTIIFILLWSILI